MDDKTPGWGVDPVPERLRALLVPALSLRDALLAILVGAVAFALTLLLKSVFGVTRGRRTAFA